MFVMVLGRPLFLAEFEHLLALKFNFLPLEFHIVTRVEEMAVFLTSFDNI